MCTVVYTCVPIKKNDNDSTRDCNSMYVKMHAGK